MKEIKKYLLIGPGILPLIILIVYPLILLFIMSFSEVNFEVGGVKYNFIGVGNFRKILSDELFLKSFNVTLVFSITCVIVELFLGLIMALAVIGIKGSTILRTVFVMGMMLPPVTVALIWRTLLSSDFGIVNYLLTILGFAPVNWLGDHNMAVLSIIVVDIWHWTGFVFLIIFAGLISLPIEPFEAAKIDGASSWQTFRFITFPLMRSTFLVAGLFRMIDIIQAFPEIWLLTYGGPSFATTILNILVYLISFQWFNWGYAATVSIIMLILSVTLAVLHFVIGKRK
ncbi:MAG: sugar ABC transporter permease [Nitrososphaeria archaeon]